MEHLAGNFKLVKDEKVFEYLVSIGIPEERAKKGAETWPNINTTVNGNTITMKTDHPPNFSTTYILDQEIDEKLSSGVVVKTTTKFDGSKLIATSTGPGGYVGTKNYEVSGDDLVVTLASPKSSVTAKKIYKKL